MIAGNRACRRARLRTTPKNSIRWLSRTSLDRTAQPVQSYTSTSRDPFLNLSIEHYLLQKSSPESVILFLYANRPSVIIGRNQNPWLEVNLSLLNSSHWHRPETEPPSLGVVDLVRRRSGGGTVFHDEGNVNWTVISPSAKFTRDKHAEMVVRALRICGVHRARVNERHDIVLDQGGRGPNTATIDTHRTPFEVAGAHEPRPLKVSGSAYKLTRGRALHHGTCLLNSPNLNVIPDYLHSPAKPYITARGVESVSSSVGNILLSNDEFSEAVQRQFAELHNNGKAVDVQEVCEEAFDYDLIRKGCDELRSPEWMYLQTPQFTVNSKDDIAAGVILNLSVRNGALTEGSVSARQLTTNQSREHRFGTEIIGRRIHETLDWSTALGSTLSALNESERSSVLAWLDEMLPAPPAALSRPL